MFTYSAFGEGSKVTDIPTMRLASHLTLTPTTKGLSGCTSVHARTKLLYNQSTCADNSASNHNRRTACRNTPLVTQDISNIRIDLRLRGNSFRLP